MQAAGGERAAGRHDLQVACIALVAAVPIPLQTVYLFEESAACIGAF